MSTHTVALDAEAYRRLRAARSEAESFSDVVKRLTRPTKHLADFAGAWKGFPKADRARLEAERRERKELDRGRGKRVLGL